jgi:hypothetical protein
MLFVSKDEWKCPMTAENLFYWGLKVYYEAVISVFMTAVSIYPVLTSAALHGRSALVGFTHDPSLGNAEPFSAYG